jgi:hypothetical protein
MRKLSILILLAVVAIACRKHNSAITTPLVDAGKTVMRELPANLGGIPDNIRKYLEQRKPKPLPKQKVPTKRETDPRVTACVESAKADKNANKDSLMSCLQAIKFPIKGLPDAGTVSEKVDAGHLFGGPVRPVNPCPALAIFDWHVSPTGNNNNTCVDAAHPCLDEAEIQSRYGCGAGPVTSAALNSVTWHLHGDMPYSSSFEMNPSLLPGIGGGGFIVECDTTIIASGVLSGVVPKNHSTDQALNANLGAGAASYYGMQIVNTTAGKTSQAWVDRTIPGADGGATNVALITQPISGPTTAIGSGPYLTIDEVDTWANGDTYNIVRPGKFYMNAMYTTFQTFEGEGNYPFFGYMPEVINCWLADDTGNGLQATLKGVNFIHSRVDMILKTTIGAFKDSFLYMGPAAMTEPIVYAGMMSSQFTNVGYIVVTSTSSEQQGGWWFDDAIVHGILVLNPAGSTTIDDNGIYCDNNFAGGSGSLQDFGLVFPLNAPSPYIYGNCLIQQFQNGYFSYLTTSPSSPSSQIFGPGVVLAIQEQNGYAITLDKTHNPMVSWLRPFNATQLFTNVELGGFGGIALPDNLQGGYYNWNHEIWTAPVPPLVWSPLYGGTGLDGGAPDGDLITGGGPGAPLSYVPPIGCEPNGIPVGTGNANNSFTCMFPPTVGQIPQFTNLSPSAIPGVELWLTQFHVTLSGANVTTWPDQSPNLNNATSVGLDPTYSVSGGPGGSGYVNFNGSQTLKSSTSVFASGNDRTLFVIGSSAIHVTNNIITFKQSPPVAGFYFSDVPTTQYIYSDNASVSNIVVTPDSGTPHLFKWGYHVGSTVTFSIDGTPIAVSGGAATSDTGSAGYELAVDPSAETGVWKVEEIVAVNHLTTITEDSIMGGYAQTDYGLTVVGAVGTGWTPVYYHSPTVSTSWTPGTITAASAATTTVTFTGATLGQVAAASFSSALPTGAILTAQVTAADTITVTLGNLSAAPIVIGAGTVYVSLP